jgi:hypothetical protein
MMVRSTIYRLLVRPILANVFIILATRLTGRADSRARMKIGSACSVTLPLHVIVNTIVNTIVTTIQCNKCESLPRQVTESGACKPCMVASFLMEE